jgi:PAS domain S-box-containing protein
VEEILRLLDDYLIFKLDDKGNFIEITGLQDINLIGKSFISIVSEEDKKKAAQLFMETLNKGNSDGMLRVKIDESYQIFNIKLRTIEQSIYGIAKEIRREHPSFITDFLGNVNYTKNKWKNLKDKNIFDTVDEKHQLMEIIKTAIDKGEYVGQIFLNEKKAKIKIKATKWLEFFIEEDIYTLLQGILEGTDINDILKKVTKALQLINQIDFSLELYDIKSGEEKDNDLIVFPIFRGELQIGKIRIYSEITEDQHNMIKVISILASKAIEKLDDFSEIINDFAVYKIDAEGRIIDANENFEKLLGYHINEIRNRNMQNYAKNRDEFFEEIKKGKIENFISSWQGKKGEIITKEYARKINGEILVIISDITAQEERRKDVEFYNSVLRHDIFNKNEIALGYLGLIEKTNLTKKQKDILVSAKNAITDSNKLIENVRKAEEIKKATRELTNTNIKQVVETVLKEYSEQCKDSEIEIICQIDDIIVRADEFISEIFSNIIKNAIEHAECKKIEIYGMSEDNCYKVYIEDDGKGMNEKYIEKIFEEGWKRGGSGSGLGLFIVKKLMDRYNGKIEVQSEEQKGMKFVLFFKKQKEWKETDLLKIRF